MCRNISTTERYLWDASNSITLSLFLLSLSLFLSFFFFFLGRHTWGYYSFPETSHVLVITVSKIDTIDSLQFQRGCIAFHRIRIISLADRSLGVRTYHHHHYHHYYYYYYYTLRLPRILNCWFDGRRFISDSAATGKHYYALLSRVGARLRAVVHPRSVSLPLPLLFSRA